MAENAVVNQPQEQPQPYVAPTAPQQQYSPPPQPQAPPPVPPPQAVQGQPPYPEQQYAPPQYPQQAYPPQQQYAQPQPPQYPQQQYPQAPGYPPQYYPHPNGQQAYLIPAPQKPKDKVRQRILIANAVIVCLVLAYFVTRPPAPPEYTRLPVDGKSNLASNAASVEYPQGTAVSEYTEPGPAGETWTAYTQVDNPSSEIELWDRTDAKLTDEATLNEFIAEKTISNSEFAGRNVDPKIVKVDGKRGYLWKYQSTPSSESRGATVVSLWVPGTQRSIRLRCEMQQAELERAEAMCNRAIKTLKIN